MAYVIEHHSTAYLCQQPYISYEFPPSCMHVFFPSSHSRSRSLYMMRNILSWESSEMMHLSLSPSWIRHRKSSPRSIHWWTIVLLHLPLWPMCSCSLKSSYVQHFQRPLCPSYSAANSSRRALVSNNGSTWAFLFTSTSTWTCPYFADFSAYPFLY